MNVVVERWSKQIATWTMMYVQPNNSTLWPAQAVCCDENEND
jgi:hypothetical protein